MCPNETNSSLDAPIGVMMLDTTFPRPVGDVGNPGSWPFPVLFDTVPRAAVRHVVGQACPPELLEGFVASGQRLVARGARALLTSCGFLVLSQSDLAQRLPVPVATSALLLIPLVARIVAPRRVGVLTYDRAALTAEHLIAAGAAPDTPLEGLGPGSAFHALIEGGAAYNADALSRDVTACADRLIRRNPDIGAIVLECTNFPPFAAAVHRATQRPVFDILTLGRWLQSGVVPVSFAERSDSA